MRLLKFLALLLFWPVFFVAVTIVRAVSSLFGISNRWIIIAGLTRCFSTFVTRLLNIRIVQEGNREPLKEGGYLIVSNHLGYLDGFVLGSLFPVIYVSKKEVREWPIIGRWVKLIGTIFVDRQSKEKVVLVVEEMAQRLQHKSNVLLFPEGTSTNGETLLPFQSAFFAAPLKAAAEVVPVTLAYTRVGNAPLTPSNRDAVCWYGDMEFAGHFWNLLSLKRVDALVTIHPKIDAADYARDSAGRKKLSLVCHRVIASKLSATEYPRADGTLQLVRIQGGSIQREAR